jgi:outer membrane protein assembly factor BamE (lipoprotein component of BamABCDE complex)
MKRISTILLAVLAISIALPACSKKADKEKKSEEHTDHDGHKH